MSKTLRFDLLVTFAGLAVLLFWDGLGLDLPAIRSVGDASGFSLRDAWFTAGIAHEGGRTLAGFVYALLIVNLFKPLIKGPSKGERIYALVMAIVCMSLIPVFKRMSHTSCPWDLAEFGGVASYVSHWTFGVLDGGPDHCFPSGHASAAFGFFSLYFGLRGSRPDIARWVLAAVLVLGVAYGWAQMARGAHYPSHTMWTAWICWVICVVTVRALPRKAIAP
jgi:membrane-associated PAP2 superfamily phosphatase